jgi:hypothetical protein
MKALTVSSVGSAALSWATAENANITRSSEKINLYRIRVLGRGDVRTLYFIGV